MRVTYYGHGVYCRRCNEVYEDTDQCEHGLGDIDGVRKEFDGGYFAQPEDMGHHSPCHFIEVDGMEQCAECDKIKLPDEMVEE